MGLGPLASSFPDEARPAWEEFGLGPEEIAAAHQLDFMGLQPSLSTNMKRPNPVQSTQPEDTDHKEIGQSSKRPKTQHHDSPSSTRSQILESPTAVTSSIEAQMTEPGPALFRGRLKKDKGTIHYHPLRSNEKAGEAGPPMPPPPPCVYSRGTVKESAGT